MNRMAIDMERFRSRYGRIRYLESISRRIPVRRMCQNDINRKLMIKFKYGNLSESEAKDFYEKMKKMIYKVMHTNNVMMDWDDVYQEIWKKIIKAKHTWKEWKGTMVSTWITIVANSVINTLRQNVNRYNSRFCLYDDMLAPSEDGDDYDGKSNCDFVAFVNEEEHLNDDGMKKMIWREQFEEFRNKLDPAEKLVFDIIMQMQEDILDACDKKIRIPYGEIRSRTGYDDATFALIVYNIKRKYCDTFGEKFGDSRSVEDDGSDTEFLF